MLFREKRPLNLPGAFFCKVPEVCDVRRYLDFCTEAAHTQNKLVALNLGTTLLPQIHIAARFK